jgi:prephenate dehydrogenase
MTPWKQATIIGVGLIGGSLGLALKKRGLARRVVGVGHRQPSLDAARAAGAADQTFLDPRDGVAGSDLVVLATPVGKFAEILERAVPGLLPGAVVIDVGSTKREVVASLEPMVPAPGAFVGCHPIAGSEQRGVAHAREDLFEGATCIVTPTGHTPADIVKRVVAIWQDVGMVVRALSPEVHDRLLADVSHLPHVVASVLVQAVSGEAESLVGPGWADTTRVASGDPGLWRDILVSNADEVAAAVERAQGVLAAFRAALSQRDARHIEALLDQAKQRRDRIVRARGNPGAPGQRRGQ